MSAQAASQRVLTVTRSCLACRPTGGQNQKAPLPSSAGDWLASPGIPSCSAPVSSTAVTRKHGVMLGQYPLMTKGCPYSWTDTMSSSAVMFSITAVACPSGSRTARPAALARPAHPSIRANCRSLMAMRQSLCTLSSRPVSTALSGGSTPTATSAPATAATIPAVSSSTVPVSKEPIDQSAAGGANCAR